MISKDKIAELADKWLKGTISEEEKQLLDKWYNSQSEKHLEWGRDKDEVALKRRLFKSITAQLEWNADRQVRIIPEQKKIGLRGWSVAAAVAVILLTVGIWWANDHYSILSPQQAKNAPIDVPPGRNAATLKLADGSVIDLDAAQNGAISAQGKAVINKQDGQVSYNSDDVSRTEPPIINTINTARGNQYQLILQDGTKVWLNSASSLKFPAVFVEKERIVELTGEAYFEVEKDKARPFRVKVNDLEVEVLGTQFNINAYSDEPVVRTTLLEGSVKVSELSVASLSAQQSKANPSIPQSLSPSIPQSLNQSVPERAAVEGPFVLLTPGQQAIFVHSESGLKVSEADIDKVMAWQSGFFEFDNTTLPEIMRQISRWYDVDVKFESEPDQKQFGGRISKNLNLDDILTLLRANGIEFALEDKTLIVKPNSPAASR